MPALSTSYLRRKVAQKQLGKRKKRKGIPKQPIQKRIPPQLQLLPGGEVFWRPKAKTKNAKRKNKSQTKPKADPLKVPATTRGRDSLEA